MRVVVCVNNKRLERIVAQSKKQEEKVELTNVAELEVDTSRYS